jgi:hypothetical protein
VPAFRVCVNTSAVHGSIGYSTNLFPAMTLGCGTAGGNITSDNIGPQHLMNIKRIAWESRPVEHRTIPADQRLAGSATTVSEARAMTTAAGAATGSGTPPATIDRQMIARIVERVFAQRGIPRSEDQRGSKEADGRELKDVQAAGSIGGWPPGSDKPEAPRSASGDVAAAKTGEPEIQIAEFVSENDVRSALLRQEKIFIGPKTIVTPSARDLGGTHEIFVET